MPFIAHNPVVKRLGAAAGVSGLAVVLVTLSGCSTAAVGASPTSTAAPTPASQQATPAPIPPFFCLGATDLDSTQRIIGIGGAQALADVTVGPPSVQESGNQALAPAVKVELLEGTLDHGDVRNVVVPAANADVVLPEGTYVLLLAPTDVDGDYLLGDGMQGSFTIEGEDVRQRCPNYADAKSPAGAKQSVPLGVLRKNAAAAFLSIKNESSP